MKEVDPILVCREQETMTMFKFFYLLFPMLKVCYRIKFAKLLLYTCYLYTYKLVCIVSFLYIFRIIILLI